MASGRPHDLIRVLGPAAGILAVLSLMAARSEAQGTGWVTEGVPGFTSGTSVSSFVTVDPNGPEQESHREVVAYLHILAGRFDWLKLSLGKYVETQGVDSHLEFAYLQHPPPTTLQVYRIQQGPAD